MRDRAATLPEEARQQLATRTLEAVVAKVGGVQVAKGQRVGLFYGSANFDEDVFEDPYTFDITRDPNPHVAFGGHGAHYCIGAALARQEIEVSLAGLVRRFPHLELAAEPSYHPNFVIRGLTGLELSGISN